MQQQPAQNDARQDARSSTYPLGRGYGHDYMRGGEVFGGYGYSARDEYERRRGDELEAGARLDADERHGPERGDRVS